MKNILAIFLLSALLFPFSLSAEHFWFGELMSLKQVCRKWGEEDLDTAKFKLASEDKSKRAKMACSLIRNKKKYIGKKTEEIKKVFGGFSGHYFSDMIPTYLIEIAKKEGEDSWQIVFLINNSGKVKNIVVHKNCCGSWKKYLILKLPI